MRRTLAAHKRLATGAPMKSYRAIPPQPRCARSVGYEKSDSIRVRRGAWRAHDSAPKVGAGVAPAARAADVRRPGMAETMRASKRRLTGNKLRTSRWAARPTTPGGEDIERERKPGHQFENVPRSLSRSKTAALGASICQSLTNRNGCLLMRASSTKASGRPSAHAAEPARAGL
jgi:hypothetical protein